MLVNFISTGSSCLLLALLHGADAYQGAPTSVSVTKEAFQLLRPLPASRSEPGASLRQQQPQPQHQHQHQQQQQQQQQQQVQQPYHLHQHESQLQSQVVTLQEAQQTVRSGASHVVETSSHAALLKDLAASRASEAARQSEEEVSEASKAAVEASNAAVAATKAAAASTAASIGPLVEKTATTTGWLAEVMEVWLQVYMVLGGITFVAAIKMTCIISNILFQVSPLPAARAWNIKKDTGTADAAPYVSIALSGCQWCFYGTFAYYLTEKSSFLVLVQSNCLGAVLGSYYVGTFLSNCCRECSLEKLYQYLSAAFSLVLLQVSALLLLPVDRALFLAGLIASLCSVLSALSMVVTLPEVVRQRDGSSIPGTLVTVGLFSALAWATCGRILNDPMVTLPNFFGALACSAALGVKLQYPGPRKDEVKKSSPADEENVNAAIADPTEDVESLPPESFADLAFRKADSLVSKSVTAGFDKCASPESPTAALDDDSYGGTGGTW